ncbi:MAG: antibiotic biosynthesis monooxygenase [Alphaproteobacteria bacterium]|nr:antibiotic biosynthesis monooxygenase [Alphaproteobacteria bacterium]
MIVVVFEFCPRPGEEARYFDIAKSLTPLVKDFDGFISIERASSVTNEGKFISVSFWRDREAVDKWHDVQKHREAQALGKAEIFDDYRITVAEIIRQYSIGEGRPAA